MITDRRKLTAKMILSGMSVSMSIAIFSMAEKPQIVKLLQSPREHAR